MTLNLLRSERELAQRTPAFRLDTKPQFRPHSRFTTVMAGGHEDFSPIRLAKECDTE
jgi:hypothetical protein